MGQECSTITVQQGDLCGSLASRCGISTADFYTYNPGSTFCNTLQAGQLVCCSEGSLPNLRPEPNPDGTCATYEVPPGEYCSLIASKFQLTVDEIETWNSNSWNWNGCGGLQRNAIICVSSGDPPMPAPIDTAICGPQAPGTARPSDWSQLATLNPCPLNACCNTWGNCGITPEFCTPPKSAGQVGCISNCGTEIAKSPSAPAEFLKVGYFQSYNLERPCLNMRADQIPSGYSHVHFSFGGITDDFAVDLSDSMEQFELFVEQTGFKKILAFGGWSYSTGGEPLPIFRNTTNNADRLRFARSVVATVEQYGLDGVDFDWEYPGAVDLGGSPTDGAQYLLLLRMVRQLLPAEKTVSLAAPASFHYLQGFPIAEMSAVVDYIVYMAYDLHGQWDYGTDNQAGCPGGNCLRSHVNLTETDYALAMVTKAGVPSDKIVVGLASYGRSFKMADRNCRADPMCRYLGPDERGYVGRCTREPGIIALAELEDIRAIELEGTVFWYDEASDSDMAQYMTDSWAAYMTETTKERRRARYQGQNFGGSVDWAIDLTAFVPGDPGIRDKRAVAARGAASFMDRRAEQV
ncbi:glycoside hydrolase superfamily [Chaetomium fimeti]|uniref:chitinase n=1 Tax=Chaetomium fimeti TaxID=1854472 RepID=A0AAE0HFV8_9PEZI|nr:glycoside hydrolase superfamily [Chaetomium fimeti]